MFQDRLAALEGAEACVATASGMSAILATSMALLKAGDHVVCSNAVFGATVQLFATLLAQLRRRDHVRSPTDAATRGSARCGRTRGCCSSRRPSNPLTEVSDIAALAAVAKKAGALLAVDNCFCTPALQRPLALGADLVIHSATKYLDGQGRVLGGAVLRREGAGDGRRRSASCAPPARTLSPFNAWVILKGMETLELRMLAQSAARAGARALAGGAPAGGARATTRASSRIRSTRSRCASSARAARSSPSR